MATEEFSGDSGDTRAITPRHNDEHRLLGRLESRRDWVIPNRSWEAAPETLQSFVENDQNEVRERISAARTLVMMSNSGIAAQSVEVRINQALAVVPSSPEEIDLAVQPAFIEQVRPDDLGETVEVLRTLGLLERYVSQVEGKPEVPTNGHTNGSANGNGHHNGRSNGKP